MHQRSIKSFLPLFYTLDVTHVRKDTRLSTLFSNW